jgi:hypothetical protein
VLPGNGRESVPQSEVQTLRARNRHPLPARDHGVVLDAKRGGAVQCEDRPLKRLPAPEVGGRGSLCALALEIAQLQQARLAGEDDLVGPGAASEQGESAGGLVGDGVEDGGAVARAAGGLEQAEAALYDGDELVVEGGIVRSSKDGQLVNWSADMFFFFYFVMMFMAGLKSCAKAAATSVAA